MKLYNTLSKSITTVSSLNKDNKVGLYACGPTVYDFAHLGHLRKYTTDDVLVRSLKKSGFEVTHVMNITDVGHLVSDEDTGEDKVEKAARKQNKTAREIADYYTADFWDKIDSMGLNRPDVSCKATEHIADQIAQIKKLEAAGLTYEIPGDGVYFDTSQDPHYGELAGLRLDQQQAGARIGIVQGKRNPADFALWKFSPQDEKRQMEWKSPFGKGFPGWHIECSAMSMKYLGEQFEIHSGGIDHIPVHHTNEIAQAEGATGKRPFVQIWIHYNFLLIDGRKMSKSLQNYYTLNEVIERGYSPMALKLLFLQAHYSDELNFTWDSLAAANTGYERLVRQVKALLEQADQSWSQLPDVEHANKSKSIDSDPLLQSIIKIHQQFVDLMNDNLKTPQALAQMWKLLKIKNPAILPYLKDMTEYFGLTIV